MADGTIIIDSQLDTSKLQTQLKAQTKEFDKITIDVEKARAALAEMEAQYATITATLREFAAEIRMSDEETDEFVSNNVDGAAELEARMMQTAEFIDTAMQRQAELTGEIERTTAAIQEAQAAEEGLENAGENVAEDVEDAARSMDKFRKRVIDLAKQVFVFTLITKALGAIKNYITRVLNSNEEFRESVAQLKGSLLIGFQPLWEVIMPALTTFISLLARAANLIARFAQWVGGLFGTNSAKAAEALYDQAEATEAAGNAAEKAKRQMSGLDEMNTWQSESSGGGGGGGSGAIAPDFSLEIKKEMSALEVFVAGATLALGAILTFTGASIPIGIALLVLGAAGIVSALAVDWNTMPNKLRSALTTVMTILGTASLTIGAILAFSGANLPLGIGLMVLGAASLGTAATLNWKTLESKISGTLGKVMTIVSAAAIVIGVILVASGVGLPLGIALILAGAAGLATAATLNWDSISEHVRGVWEDIRSWFQTDVKPKLTLEFWKGKFKDMKDAFVDRIKGGINGAIEFFNRFIDWVNEKMHLEWDDLKILGTTIIKSGSIQLLELKKIPLLAKGAVIPANHEFLAVLGDQKQGTNIEAPEDLIRKIVREEAGGSGKYTFVAQLDKRTIFEAVIDQARLRQGMTGKNPFKLGV